MGFSAFVLTANGTPNFSYTRAIYIVWIGGTEQNDPCGKTQRGWTREKGVPVFHSVPPSKHH